MTHTLSSFRTRITSRLKRTSFCQKLVLASSFTYSVALLAVLLCTRGTTSLAKPFDIPTELKLGGKVPSGSNCTIFNYEEESLWCSYKGFNFIYNYWGDTTEHISKLEIPSQYTVGELILLWGQPTAYYRYSTSVYYGIFVVCWGRKYVYAIGAPISGETFSPEALVTAFEFSNRNQSVCEDKWIGFINARSNR